MRKYFSALLLLFTISGSAGNAQGFCMAESEGSSQFIEFGVDIESAPDGSFFVTGGFKNQCEFGGVNYPAVGLTDLFLAKYSRSGMLVWLQRLGGSGPDMGNELDFATDGDIYVTGNIKLGVEPGENNHLNLHAKDAMFARYDSAGNQQWFRIIDGNNYSEGYGITVDDGSVAYGAAIFNTEAYLLGDTLHSRGSDDIVVIAYSATGIELWAQSFGSKLKDGKPCIAHDGQGNLWMAASFQDTLIHGTDTLVSAGMNDIFIVKMTTAGAVLDLIHIPGSGDDFPTAIKTTSSGDFYLSGRFDGNLTLNSVLNTQGFQDAFVAKFNSSGVCQWNVVAGGVDYNEITDIDLGSFGDVFFGGYSYDVLNVDTFSLPNGGLEDMFFGVIHPDGTVDRVQQPPISDSQYLFGLAADDADNVLVTGSYFTTMTLNGITLNAVSSSEDIFWAKYGETVQLTLDSISGPPSCINDAFAIWFSATGCYEPGNIFTAELSDASGSFATPYVLGTMDAISGGQFLCNVPAGVTGGSGYRVRVAASQPSLISNDNGFDITLAALVSNPPAIAGDTVVCMGDTILLDAGPGFILYDWSTGATAQTILVTSPGLYSVEVTDTSGCTGFDDHLVGACVSTDETAPWNSIEIYPVPANEWMEIKTQFTKVNISILTVQGVVLQASDGQGTIRLDISGLPAGYYLVRMQSGSREKTFRIAVAH